MKDRTLSLEAEELFGVSSVEIEVVLGCAARSNSQTIQTIDQNPDRIRSGERHLEVLIHSNSETGKCKMRGKREE